MTYVTKIIKVMMTLFLFQPGSDLAAELGVTAQDDVLFAVFSTPDSSEGKMITDDLMGIIMILS